MDERIEKALKFANYKISHANQRANLRTQLDEQLIFGINGGSFEINQTLISFVSVLSSKTNSGIILDKNENPILIENLAEFLDEILSRYMEHTNLFYQEYTNLNKTRNVKDLINFEEDKLSNE